MPAAAGLEDNDGFANAIDAPLTAFRRSRGVDRDAVASLAPVDARAQNAVVVVNGDPITNFDIEQRTKLIALSGGKSAEPSGGAGRAHQRPRQDQGRQEVQSRYDRGRGRDPVRDHGRADAAEHRAAEQGSGGPRHSAGGAEGAPEGRFHLGATGPRTLRPEPDRRREGHRLRDRGQGRRQGADRQLRIQDAAGGAVRAKRFGAVIDRAAEERRGNASRTGSELRAGRKPVPRHA